MTIVYYSVSYSLLCPAFTGPESFDILRGHSRATMFLICNNAAQGILSSFFFKYAGKGKYTQIFLFYHEYFFNPLSADTILKKYSSTVATIFTGLASAAFLGQPLTVNFLLGISIVFISMHQVFVAFYSLARFFTQRI